MLKGSNLLVGERVSLGNHRNEVDSGVKPAHHLDIERLQRVAGGLDEVHTCVNAVVDNVHAVDFVLGIEVCVKALLDALHDRSPRVIVVDEIAKARGVNDVQSQTNAVFFNIRADGLDGDGLGGKFEARLFALFRRVERSVEERIDESGLSEAGFP